MELKLKHYVKFVSLDSQRNVVKLRLMTYRDVSNGGKFIIESRSKAKDLLLGEMTCSKFN